jgi:hypothetical protein
MFQIPRVVLKNLAVATLLGTTFLRAADVFSGISGPGEPVQGSGLGGWRSGHDGVRYKGPHPKAGALYAFVLEWPASKTVVIRSLATGSPHVAGRKVTEVVLLGYAGKLTWSQDEAGLRVELPDAAPSEHAVALKITGVIASQ